MNLHVNRSFSLKSIPVIARRPMAAEPAKDARAELAAQFVPAGARVLDLSAANGLQRLLPEGCDYHQCDLANIDACGFAETDVVVMLGTLERVVDLEGLFARVSAAKPDVILSYRARDLDGPPGDRLSFFELTTLFDRHGLRIQCTAPAGAAGMLMRLTAAERLKPVMPCRIAVIADDRHTFGERIGRAMIQSLLPGEAEVDHLTPATLAKARASYDLVVLGTGGGLMRPLVDDGVFEVIGRARAAVGIFGTQYRELLPRAALDRLIERLDTWYARHQDDVLLYGRGHGNVVHLGDWTIDRFPLAAASVDEPLRITTAAPTEGALDRTIATIQRHRRVYSEQLHPLLCALTAAETAAYAERPTAAMPGAARGQFGSMLVDIFGRSYPEKEFFLVDRDAVARYKARVHGNVVALRDRIETLLRNRTVAAA